MLYRNCAQKSCLFTFALFFLEFEAGIFLALVGGTAAIFGFSKTVLSSRKQDQELYEKGCVETARLLEGGHKLATRALAWGTFYAFLGTGTFCYGLWKLSGARNVRFDVFVNRFGGNCLVCQWMIEYTFVLLQMDEFRQKMGSVLPRLTRDAKPNSRTEFDGLTDLMGYLSTWRRETEPKE